MPPRQHPGAHRTLFLLGLLVAALAVRCYEIDLPYLKVHEAGFQESLALNHLDYGLLHNRFLSLMAEADSQEYFHVSHPPLLQYILALAFALFGVSEAVARAALLPFSLGTIALTYHLASEELSERIGRIAGMFLALSLLSSYFSRIVNYEFLAQFFVVLVYVLYLRQRRRPSRTNLALLLMAFVLGCLSDWPFYLILPALVGHAALSAYLDRPILRHWRKLVLPAGLLAGGFAMVALYLGYQDLVTGRMMLLEHGRNRMAGNLLLEPGFYRLLAGRLFKYAPFLCFLAPVGLLVALDRKPRALLTILPLLFVPVAYVVLFAQAAEVHEWSLYYFAVPMALAAAAALDWMLAKRRLLLPVVCGSIVLVLVIMNLRFHQQAKQGVFSALHDVSVFMHDHLPPDSLVYSAIYCQAGYYLEGRAEVLYGFAKGDLTRHSFDCYLLDRAAADPTLRKLFAEGGPGENYRSITRAPRFDLTCRGEHFAGHLLLRDDEAGAGARLLRFGEDVRLAVDHPLGQTGTTFSLDAGDLEVAPGDRLSLSIALSAPSPRTGKLRIDLRMADGERRTVLERDQWTAVPNAWQDVTVRLQGVSGRVESWIVEFAARPGPAGVLHFGDPVVEGPS